jgi:predicted RNA methylase
MEKDISTPATKYNKSETLSPAQAAEILGVTQDTVRNWNKTGRLSAASPSPLLFLAKDIYTLRDNMASQGLLQSRRNKKLNSSNYIPKNYIDLSSPNYPIIRSIITEIGECCYDTHVILALYAKELLQKCNIPRRISDVLIQDLESSSISSLNSDADYDRLTGSFPLEYIPGEDTLGMLYICLRRLQEKKSTGSYYTPFYVVDRLISDLSDDKDLSILSVCDPACGTGNFLLRLPSEMPLKNVYGQDIDRIAIAITRINLALKYRITTKAQLKILTENIRTSDFLFEDKNRSFDVILGNPPWGYSYSKDAINNIRNSFTTSGTGRLPESFSLFVEEAINNLRDEGLLSFLLPETILSAGIHRDIRSFILSNAKLTSLSYLGDVFDKVQCPSVILTLQKGSIKSNDCYANVTSLDNKKNALIESKTFTASTSRIDSDSFHLLCDDNTYSLLLKIEATDHFTLKGNADFALGIVTGSNKTLISNEPKKDYERIIKGKDIDKFRIQPNDNFIRFTPKKFQQCAPESFYRAQEKLFYRFIADEPVIAYDNNRTLSLNSANIIVPHVDGYSPEYIMAILNSSVISFYYRNSFKNLKVLRSCLEQLPIAKCSADKQQEIIQLSRAITAARPDSTESEKLIKEINAKIQALYGFTFPV